MNDFWSAVAADSTPHDADGIAESVLLAIRKGSLPAGARLPTVQTVATRLGVSTSTVVRAWAALKQMGLIETRRRGGTVVTRPADPTAYRFRGQRQEGIRHRLAAGYPDLDLAIDLRRLLRRVADSAEFTGYLHKDELSPALQDGLAGVIGYHPVATMLASDVISTLHHTLRAVVARGATIAIAQPEFPLYGVVLRQLGVHTARVPVTPAGYDIAALERALSSGVRAFLVQSRVHAPTGIAIPNENVEAMAAVLARHGALAVEVDHHAQLLPDAVTLGSLMPDSVIHMVSFAKSLHPDLRVAAVSGPERLISQASAWRSGGAWVSGVNRALLEAALQDPATETVTERAREEYARRRSILASELQEVGRDLASNAGLHAWVEVESEEAALVSLAARGIAVAGGRAYFETTPPRDHVYLSLGLIGSDPRHFAQAIADASVARLEHSRGTYL